MSHLFELYEVPIAYLLFHAGVETSIWVLSQILFSPNLSRGSSVPDEAVSMSNFQYHVSIIAMSMAVAVGVVGKDRGLAKAAPRAATGTRKKDADFLRKRKGDFHAPRK